jgi:peptide/nickel transport system permease protein
MRGCGTARDNEHVSTTAGRLPEATDPVRSPRAIALSRLRRDRIGVAAAALAVAILAACFVGAPVLARVLGHGPNDPLPYAIGPDFRPVGPWTRVPAVTSAQIDDEGNLVDPAGLPTTLLVLGADGPLGRDLLLRILYGGVVTIEVALLAVAIALLLGLAAGGLAGMLGGVVDAATTRLTELAMSMPVLFLLVLIGTTTVGSHLQDVTLGVFNQGVVSVALLIGLFTWFFPARLVRTQIVLLRRREFVDAALAAGAGRWRIFRHHLLPHLVPSLAAWATTGVAIAMLFEIGVTFLNAGVRLPTSSWGRLLADTWGAPLFPSRFDPAQQTIWPTVFTSLVMFLTVAAIYEVGEAIQRATLVERR